MISDAALTEAAFAVDEAILNTLPKPGECDHVFSPAFERKMRKLIRKANHPVAYKVLNRAACALLALVLSASLLLTFHPKARAAVVDWIKEKVEDFYHYFAPEKESEPEAEAATPEQYCLGKGHMKWAKKHSFFLLKRYGYLLDELIYRGFKISHSFDELHYLYSELTKPEDENDYFPTSADIELSRNRISERINKKPNFYRWTKRKNKENLK